MNHQLFAPSALNGKPFAAMGWEEAPLLARTRAGWRVFEGSGGSNLRTYCFGLFKSQKTRGRSIRLSVLVPLCIVSTLQTTEDVPSTWLRKSFQPAYLQAFFVAVLLVVVSS